MPYIPAICDTCGTIFNSGIYIENVRHLTFSETTAGPCPRCNNTGHIPDGLFNVVGNAIEILSAPERTFSELKRFNEILQNALLHNHTPEQVEKEIQKDSTRLDSLLDFLPKNREEKRDDFKFWITAFLMILQTVLPLFQNNGNQEEEKLKDKIIPKIEVNQVINNIYQNQTNTNTLKQTRTESINKSVKTVKIGRNNPCPCGSGKKYKRCHLLQQ